MKLVLEINNPQKLELLLELVRSLDFVEKVQVTDEPAIQENPRQISFFKRFYGSARTGQTVEEIDAQIEEMRKEWDRDF